MVSHIFYHIFTKSPVALNIETRNTLQDSLAKQGYYILGSQYHTSLPLSIPCLPSLPCPLSSHLLTTHPHFSPFLFLSHFCGQPCPFIFLAPSTDSFGSKAQSILLFFGHWNLLMWFDCAYTYNFSICTCVPMCYVYGCVFGCFCF